MRVTLVAALIVGTACSDGDGPSLVERERSVTIRYDWDAQCNSAWMMSYERRWRSVTAPPAWQDAPAGDSGWIERTGTVQNVDGNFLQYRDDDGTVVQFGPDVPQTNCS